MNVTNCTFTGNSAPDASAIFIINISTTLKNCIVHNNTGSQYGQIRRFSGVITVTYSCVTDSLWAGAGNITSNPMFAPGPQGNFYLSQTASGQASNSPAMNAGDPASAMITGTTRTDQVQDAGITDLGFHYKIVSVPPPPVTVILTALNPPIQIPVAGGSFSFNLGVANGTAVVQTIDIWTNITLPNGSTYGPIYNIPNFTVPASWSGFRLKTQSIPGNAPTGQYTYNAYVGDYPNTVMDEEHFNFTKLSAGDNCRLQTDSWECTGWDDEAEMALFEAVPANVKLNAATPNPFNPTTNLSFTITEPAEVYLAVYDIRGREIAVLAEGFTNAGTYERTFDGSELGSGVYFARLQAGKEVRTQKLLLVK